MILHKNFTGGNFCIENQDRNTFYIERELRDTREDWFYWAFCVEGAAGKTLTFLFNHPNRVGYYGAAVSSDLKNWRWSNTKIGEGFTYTFSKQENRVYFAHHMLYHPDRFFEFAKDINLETKVLCISERGREVPFAEFGSGDKTIVLTARHHACESTGNYPLEGLIKSLKENPIKGYKVFCVPFVDYDGVIDGDQGKDRIPHDHNRDYEISEKPIYRSVEEIRKYITAHQTFFGFDFHSPWHCGAQNDKIFIPQKSIDKLAALNSFSEILEKNVTGTAMRYCHADDIPPNTGWNQVGSPCFGTFVLNQTCCKVAFTLETAYFGTEDNIFSQASAIRTGECFADALREYIAGMSKRIVRDVSTQWYRNQEPEN